MSRNRPLANLRAQISRCTACGLCLPACPTYNAAGLETHGPRGRVAIAAALAHGRINPADAAASIYGCLVCGRCQRACPLQLPLNAIFLAARGAMPLPASLLPSLLGQWPALNLLRQLIALAQCHTRLRSWPPIAARPFPERTETKSANTALLFPGCICQGFFGGIIGACAELLARRGYEVLIPPSLPCCGRPLALRGHSLDASIRKNLKLLAQFSFQRIITPCPGCQDAIVNIWPEAAGLSAAERGQVRQLAEKCAPLLPLLAERPAPMQPGTEKTFWHRPCLMDDIENAASISLLARATAFCASNEPDCCGAPLLCSKNSLVIPAWGKKLARKPANRHGMEGSLAKNILRNAKAARASGIACACPGCMLSLHRCGDLPLLHITQVLNHAEKAAATAPMFAPASGS